MSKGGPLLKLPGIVGNAILAVASIILIASAVGIVSAHPGAPSSGVIHGCVRQNGQLEVIDASTSCAKNTTPLDWNIQGMKGEKGDQGDPGAKGDKGDPGTTSPGVTVLTGGGIAESCGPSEGVPPSQRWTAPSVPIACSTARDPFQTPMPAGIAEGLRVREFIHWPAESVYVVRKNGEDTALTCTISDPSPFAPSCEDSTHSVTFAAGDLLSLRGFSPSGILGLTTLTWSLEFSPLP
jgi:hypothetical protein